MIDPKGAGAWTLPHRRPITAEVMAACEETGDGLRVSGLEANLLLYILDDMEDGRGRCPPLDALGAVDVPALRARLFAAHRHPEEPEDEADADPPTASAGRNGWMTPEALARHTDPRAAEEIEVVARAIAAEDAPREGAAGRAAYVNAYWPDHQGRARAAIVALRALDDKWRGAW